MPSSRLRSQTSRITLHRGGALFDLTLCVFLGIWLFGGVHFRGHLYLRHGADPRRIALLIALAGSFVPRIRQESIFLKGVLRFRTFLSRSWFRWGIFFLVFLGALALSIQQALALRVTLYDVGIFHQILWSLSQGLGFHSTISGAGNFLQDHLSPSLLLLVPFFKLFGSSPLFLPAVQTLLLFGGGAAWIYLAARVPGGSARFRKELAASATVFVVSFDSLWGNLKWGFHENAIAFCSLSWALALLFAEGSLPDQPGSEVSGASVRNLLRNGIILILFLIAAASKEILLVDIAFSLICWATVTRVRARQEGKGLLNTLFAGLLLAMAIALVIGFIHFEMTPHPADKNYFNRYYSYLGENLGSFFSTLIWAPSRVVHTIGAGELIRYGFVVLFPWLFLPLAWVGWARLDTRETPFWGLVALPSFASAALATYPPLRRAEFHYVLELWPVLACLTLFALARMRSSTWVWAWALCGLLRMDADPIAQYREYAQGAESAASMRKLIRRIPVEASVSADELAGPWVSGRKWVSRWPDVSLIPRRCPDYVLLQQSEKGKVDQQLAELAERCLNLHSGSPPQVPLWTEGSWSIYDLRL